MDKIKVAVRARPLNKRELDIGASQIVTINDNQVILNDKEGKNVIKSFTYDCCFDSTCETKPNYANQKRVFDELGVELLENVFAGYNTCMFAYGQTGSGKSYTMMGMESDDQKGLIPRLCESLFDKISTNTNDDHLFKIEVSFIEIYNEKVRDLLDPSGSKQNLKLREHRLLGVYVDGLTQLAVSSYKDIEVIMNKGNKSRTVAATNMNAESSRSHAVFCLQVSQNIIDKSTQLSGEKLSRLSLVDLAGSEKVSKTGAEGYRLKEGCNINKSLTTLGLVISTLSDNTSTTSNKSKIKHIPYRDSVLTWLLKDSLGGNSKTIMISTISTASDNYDETLSTLRYADRAKRIVNNAIINEDPNAKLIRSLRDELEMLKRELEKTREQLGGTPSDSQLNDRLKESEKLYNEISKPWNERLAESEIIQQELSDKLQLMGISVQSSGIKVETDQYFLVNINSDPSMNELLVYYLKEITLIGRPNAETKQDIQLNGPGISLEHCVIEIKNNCVFITPMNNSKTRINGLLIKKETKLQHGDRIEIGINHFFRLNCPLTSDQVNKMKKYQSEFDLVRAQEEILFSKLKELDETDLTIEETSEDLNNKSLMSTSSSSSSLGQPVYEIIQNSTCLYAQDDQTHQILNGYRRLRDQLVKTHSLAREANSISKELNLTVRFTVTLHTPAKNLTPNHKKDTFLFEPAVIVKQNNQQRCLVDMDKFEIYCLNLREMYFIFQNNSKLFEDDERKSSIVDPIIDQIVDSKLNNTLIGVANVYLDSLFVESCIEFEYNVPIINDIGDLNGKLKIKLKRLEMMGYENDGDVNEDNLNRKIKFKLEIIEAYDLPKAENNSIYCQYQFWIYSIPFIVHQINDNSTNRSQVKFDYQNEFSIELTDEFMEYCLDGCLSIELYGQNILPRELNLIEKKKAKLKPFEQINHYDNLIQNWNELSRSFEIYVHILELNTDGNWQPVEVKQHDLNQTGGIYQLKQGQSRQISVRIKQTNPNSKLFYQGSLFNLEPHKIDKISAGCVLGRDIGLNQPLDSYQEIDLNKLKEKCKNILEMRKQYIYEQLKELETLNNEDDKERYELLCKQLFNLGEEIASIDAPPDNSNLPGSTIDWQPSVNMEEHVPIIYLDLTNSLNKTVQINDDTLNLNDYDDYEKIEAKKALNSLQCGQETYLKHEQAETQFYDLKIIRWNNSEMIEFSADGDVQENDLFDDSDLIEKSLASPTFKALALWDASIHNSPYLNQITPFDKHIYLTLKINLKLKFKNYENVKYKYVDVVLRKRISVNIYSPSVTSTKFSLFKNLLVSGKSKPTGAKSIASSQHSTSLIYRIISDIPRSLTEIENRELFALKAATTLINNENDSSKTSFFEKYLKTIKSVESILKKDRLEQQLVIKNISKSFYKKSELNKSFNTNNEQQDSIEQQKNSSRMKKTFSVPNLIKNSLGIINTINQAREATFDKLITNESVSASSTAAAFEYNKTQQIIDSAKVNNLSFKDIILTENNHKTNQYKQLNEHINNSNQINKPLSNLDQSESNQISSSSITTNNNINNNNNNNILNKKQENKENLLISNNNNIINNNVVIEFSPASKSDKSDFLLEKHIDKNTTSDIITTIISNDDMKAQTNLITLDQKIEKTNLDQIKTLSESNHSIASTLTNSSQLNSLTSQEKLPKRSQESLNETVPDWVKENGHVIVSTNTVQNKRGYIRYVGPTKFAHGVWVGVELEEPHGKNDGALKGVRYFKCPENRGVFVKADKLTLVSD